MPRSPRLVHAGHPHHVIFRGNNRRRLFSYPRDYLRFLGYLEDAARRAVHLAVHVFVLMPNHVHLLVTPPDGRTLSGFVQRACQRYAQHRNASRDGSGKLFEERYLCVPIESEQHLAVSHAYIELNPDRAGLGAPAEYAWSSYHRHADDGSARMASRIGAWLEPAAWYLSLAKTEAARRRWYGDWVRECRTIDRTPDHWRAVLDAERASTPYTKRLERPNRKSAG